MSANPSPSGFTGEVNSLGAWTKYPNMDLSLILAMELASLNRMKMRALRQVESKFYEFEGESARRQALT